MFNFYTTCADKKPIGNRFFALMLLGLFMPALPDASLAQAEQGLLTLEQSIRRAIEIAPEMKSADAKIGKQQGALEQAGAWPNPSISVQVDDSLRAAGASGGYGVTEFSISQALPFTRLAHQRQQAEAGLASVKSQQRYQQLLLEYRVAKRFHILQLQKAKLQLAKKRLLQARRYQKSGHKRRGVDSLIRYLTPLETMRLNVMLNEAKESVEVAEMNLNVAAASFKALLGISIDDQLNLVSLTQVPTLEKFNALENSLQHHAALMASKQAIASLQAGTAVAESQRFSDPTLTIFRKNELFPTRRRPDTGIMLSVQVPLWNQNNGSVTEARYAVYQAQAELDFKQRELHTKLRNSYQHLEFLLKQAKHYRSKRLNPTKRMFILTRKGFKAGELNILTLIDASNIYFDVQARYLSLLQEGWLELANLRRSAGLSLLTNSFVADSGTHFGEVK